MSATSTDSADLLNVIAAAIAFLEALRELFEPAPSAAPAETPRPAIAPRLQRIDIDGPE